ncbi:TetR/AcrR family transcriptional regulator [Allonocardiopsis opalescens]|uniref:TetR family transcriptional regulator n=1 Tax=Allonocardiopsis opalescens TaxID=1144618 RepID=A0A2T0QF58_9ACTN|nr:TetR/AcrR family transcriptional regulator [Allonocardiopsis opalescens]PRY02520.1 TetR family transcriptional regulator [Allonocardiopsis opalescens]
MPAAFSAEEKTRITELLLESGRRLFTTRGLRKTSLDELVAPAGIAKSSFYQFFDSKEALYLELMMRQTAQVKRHVIDEGLLAGGDVRDGLRRFLRATVTQLTTDPLYGRLMTHPEEMAAVTRRLDPSRVADDPDNPLRALTEFIVRGQERGELVATDPAVIIGVIQAVVLTPVHADRLSDPERFPAVLDLLIDVVTAGLAPRKE